MAEQCVKIYLQLTDEYGTEEERERISELTDDLEDAIEKHDAGEFDGDEFGGGQCVLYMYGPDADKVFGAIENVLKKAKIVRGGYAIKRYGPPADGIKEKRVKL